MSSTSEVFKDTFSYLEQNIEEDFYCEDFSKSDAIALYDKLLKKHSKRELRENRAEIRKAFKSYFQLLNQKVSLFFQGHHTIIIKDLKKQIYGEFSKQFHTMSKKLEVLEQKLGDFKSSEGIYMIDKESLNDFGCDFDNIEDSALKRELYKQAVKDALHLHERDLVFCMNQKITVKKFVEASQRSPKERRAEGLPTDELERLKNMVFEKNIYDEIESGMYNLMRSKLDFTVINNEFFRKHVIEYVQDELYKVMSIYMDEDSDATLKKAFVNYIFREHFANIHKIFAKHLLELHSKRDKNVENFLRYFDGNIELIDDKQVQKPEIIDANDQKWNAVSILPIVIQKQKNDREIEIINQNNLKAEDKIFSLRHRIETINEENKKLEERKEGINNHIKDIITQSKELQDENTQLKKRKKRMGKDSEELQNKINAVVAEIKKLGREEDRLRVSIRDINNAVDVNKTKILNINVDIQAQEKLINDNKLKKANLLELHQPVKEKYHLIVEAVSKALMHKY
ncbi:MAG: hypothetical protein ACQESH_08855 [Campylobacterota bacterium]